MRNLIFMGTPEFSAICLEKLISFCRSEDNKNIEISAVVTQPDKPRSRGNALIPSPVKELAIKNNIPVLQPEKLDEIYTQIVDLKPFIIIVVAYGKILSKKFLDIPTFGCINLHASLLPKYRGPAPIQWAIINGEKKTGVSTILMDEGIDTGKIIFQKETEIGDDETYGELSKKLAHLGAELLIKTIKSVGNYLSVNGKRQGLRPMEGNTFAPQFQKQSLINNRIKEKFEEIHCKQQDENSATYFPAIKKEDAKINWEESAEKIKNKIRAFNPTPVAYTFFKGERLKIWEAKVFDSSHSTTNKLSSKLNGKQFAQNNTNNHSSGEFGKITKINRKNGIYVACGEGTLIITKLQREGKKVLPADEFLRGYKIFEGEFFKN